MRIHIASDLHLERSEIVLPPVRSDVSVFAGDLHFGTMGLDWIRRSFPRHPAVYVAGNHEFYGRHVDNVLWQLRSESRGTSVRFLENKAVEINGWTFLGCTLWTDFALYGDAGAAMEDARHCHSDFRVIAGRAGVFHPGESVRMHNNSFRWLKNSLGRVNISKTVVVTHHAPSERSIRARNRGQLSTCAYASALDKFIAQSGVPLWIHGHTHHCVDYKVGKTRVLSNQARLGSRLNPDFRPGLVVEL